MEGISDFYWLFDIGVGGPFGGIWVLREPCLPATAPPTSPSPSPRPSHLGIDVAGIGLPEGVEEAAEDDDALDGHRIIDRDTNSWVG